MSAAAWHGRQFVHARASSHPWAEFWRFVSYLLARTGLFCRIFLAGGMRWLTVFLAKDAPYLPARFQTSAPAGFNPPALSCRGGSHSESGPPGSLISAFASR